MKKSRRDFLKLLSTYSSLGVSAASFNSILDTLFLGSINEALAAGVSNSKLLVLQAYAAPERWVFDKFLDPYNSNRLQGLKTNSSQNNVNNQVVNYLTERSGRLIDSEYRFANVNGIKSPYLWSQNVGSANGGSRPMSDLLNNYINIRGIDNGNGVHPISAAQQVQAAVGGASITGVVADASNAPLSHVAVNPVYSPFVSNKGKGRLRLGASSTGGTDLIAEIKKPFSNQSEFINNSSLNKNLLAKMESFNSVIDNSLAKKKNLSASAESALGGAKDLMFDKLDKMIGDYASLKAKYVQVIQNTMDIEMLGINNKAVGLTPVSSRDKTYNANSKAILEDDLRNIVPYFRYKSGRDETLDYMADVFALAEYSMVNAMSDSVHLRILPWIRLKLRYSSGLTFVNQNFDAHQWGAISQVIVMTSFYACLSACLLELIDQFKAAGIYKDSLIQFSGEFERRPRKDGSGSDHAGHASTVSLWSGKIDGAQVLGNVQNATHSTYFGSYGYASEDEDGHIINMGNVASTVADILQVQSPSPNNFSLVSVNNGKVIVPEKRLGKNKEIG